MKRNAIIELKKMEVRIKEKQVNIAVQVLPFSKEYDVYPIVDEAIRIIKESGVKHRVTPFETVLEGKYGINSYCWGIDFFMHKSLPHDTEKRRCLSHL